VKRYWVCQKRRGAFPKVLEQVLSDRERYLNLLKEENDRAIPDIRLVEEYQTHQLGAKLFANAGFGVFGNEYFEFTNYQVAECITAEGRRIHKQMEAIGQNEPYNFKVVFGFTDSTFFEGATEEKIRDFIEDCKDKLGVIVELKRVFINSIFYGKKNRYVGWTGNDDKDDEPIIKGPDGLSDSNPIWIQKWFKKIVVEIIKHPKTRFEVIPKMLKEAFNELDNGNFNAEIDLRYTHRLRKHTHEYTGHARAAALAKLLYKDKGDLVYCYETFTEEYIASKKCWKRKKSYSVKPEKINLEEYKNLLLRKLKDTLEIAGFNVDDLRRQQPSQHTATIPISQEVDISK